jgi:hypothetical protein
MNANYILILILIFHLLPPVASAAILTARRLLRVSPTWSNELSAATGYSSDSLEACSNLIEQAYTANFATSIQEMSPQSTVL